MRTSDVCDELRVTPEQLADRLGIKRQSVYDWRGIVPARRAIQIRMRWPRVPLRPEDYAEQAE